MALNAPQRENDHQNQPLYTKGKRVQLLNAYSVEISCFVPAVKLRFKTATPLSILPPNPIQCLFCHTALKTAVLGRIY